jgi:hypothetical protein
MSPASTKQTVEELRARRQAEHEAEDRRRAEEDRLFEEEIWKLAEEEERQKQKEEDKRRREEDERKKRLEVAEKEYARQKKLEKARWEKRKAVELEDSGEETEKEPEGSNKKVSPDTYMNSVELMIKSKPDGGRILPPYDKCAQADKACLWKARGPGCQ